MGNKSMFDGDGREKILPTIHFPGTNPIAVTRSTARQLIAMFEESGRSNHSGAGSTLWVTLQHCVDTGTPYLLKAYPNWGYEVTKAPELE